MSFNLCSCCFDRDAPFQEGWVVLKFAKQLKNTILSLLRTSQFALLQGLLVSEVPREILGQTGLSATFSWEHDLAPGLVDINQWLLILELDLVGLKEVLTHRLLLSRLILESVCGWTDFISDSIDLV